MPGFSYFPSSSDESESVETMDGRELTPESQRLVQRRTVIARSRTGCNNCKRRRIKCDETKPICVRCQRGNRDCSYQAPRTWTFQQDSSTTSSGTPEPGIEETDRHQDLSAQDHLPHAYLDPSTRSYLSSSALASATHAYAANPTGQSRLINIVGQSLPPPGMAIAQSNSSVNLNVKGILQEFLTTIGRCVPSSLAATHLSLRRGTFGSDQQTLNVRSLILPQINRLLSSERTQTSDQTIISLGHQLFVDLFTGTAEVIASHVNGLGHLVESRGGMSQLGLNGEIAHVLKAFVFEASVAAEIVPPSVFMGPTQWTPWVDAFDPGNDHFLESPILWTQPPFSSNTQRLPIQGLLDEMRLLTEGFVNGTTNRETEQYEYRQIVMHNSMPLVNDGQGTQSDWICETLRITSLIFAAAICYRVPISRAVWRASTDTNDPVILERYSNAFTRSGYTTSPYWDDYASSLLWASLVASAVARCVDDLEGVENFEQRSQARRAQLTMPLGVGARFCHTHLQKEAFLSIGTMIGVQAKLAGRGAAT